MHALALRAGPDALHLLRERGLRTEDVDLVPAASGGPKWLAIAGLVLWRAGAFDRDSAGTNETGVFNGQRPMTVSF